MTVLKTGFRSMPVAHKIMVVSKSYCKMFFHVFMLTSFLIFSCHASSFSEASTGETICGKTPFPKFCGFSLLSSNRSAYSLHDYGRLSVRHSLLMTENFLAMVNGYLSLPPFAFSESTIHALQDCQMLANLNKEFLTNTIQAIGYTISLPYLEADYMQTLLSATLTNHQTCLDGLQETSSPSHVRNVLLAPLTNGSKSYSVSLALFLHGWSTSTDQHRRRAISNGRWLKEMMKFTNTHEISKAFDDNVKGRKLLQEIGSSGGIRVRETVVVDPYGRGNFTTITDAVDAAPNNTALADGYFLIRVVAGVYEEYVTIGSKKMNIMIVGDGINQTIITGNRSVVDGWTTFNSATFAVSGMGFVAVNITFRNTAGAVKHQAVAVRNSADSSVFYNCSFEGYQDTVYVHSMRQFYRECDIYGTVDFIFGNAATVLQNCNLYPRLPMDNQFNAITAQGRSDPNQNTGISIQNCKIKAAPDLASRNNGTTIIRTFLGRPWKEYSRTVYMQTDMDSVVDPSGWSEWSGNFALTTLYYGEYNNTGTGATTENRVSWPGYHVMDANDAANFTVSSFIEGDNWLHTTGVSYTSGLS